MSGVTGQKMDLSYRLAVHYETVAAAYRDLEQGPLPPGPALPPLHRPLPRRQGPHRPTTVQEVLDLYRSARPTPAGS